MASGRLRLVLVLDAAAIAAVALVASLGAGLPLAAAGALHATPFALVASIAAVAALAVGAPLLVRWIARPLERLFAAAGRLEAAAGQLPLAPQPGGLAAAAVAFERAVEALAADRAELAAKVAELSRANLALADTRETLLRAERLATVGRLAAGIAHEVGNPLGAIGGYAELARGRVASGDRAAAEDFLARISADVGRIDRIVRDLLDFARPAPPALAPVAVAGALDAAVRLARVQARFKGVEVRTALPPDLPAVWADERRLAQVLLNLLLNAGDAMGGAGEVRIEARAGEEGVEVTVADGGPGFAPADLGRAFDPFFTTKDPGQGTGLGLAVCDGIMRSFGGEIAAENGAAGGAVLRLRFRRPPGGAPAAAC